jgi:penicillin-binding protein activator
MKRYMHVVVLAAMLAGCSGGTKVERMDPAETMDLSGRWNDTDSRLVSEEMIADCMSRPWKMNHVEAKGKRPIMIVGQIRGERADQQQYSSEESVKQWGREHGADYMLGGVMSSIEDREGGESVVFYQVDLNLINLETNTKVWQGQKKIKKYISRSSYSR